MFKKSVLIIFGIIFISLLTAAVNADIRGIPSYSNIYVDLLNQEPDPAEPGEFVELRFSVANTGEQSNTITFELVPKYPFEEVPGEDYSVILTNFDTLGAESKTLLFKLKVADDAVEGTNSVELRYKIPGRDWIIAGPFDVLVRTQDAILAVDDVYSKPETIMPGQESELKIQLKNYADSVLKDVHVELELGNTNFAPIGSTDERTIKRLSAGETVTLSYNIIADADAAAMVHKVPIYITYNDELGNSYSRNNTIGIPVDGAPSYMLNLEDSKVYESGQMGEIVLSVSNIGPSDIKFLILELLPSPDYEILSNTKEYLGNLESDDFETSEFTIHINAVKKDIPLKVKLYYRDNYNQEFDVTEEINLKVYSSRDAVKYGLAKSASFLPGLLTWVFIVLTIFWIYMLYDIIKNPLKEQNKQILWLFIMLFTYIIGAFLYFIYIRKKR